jgi:hypothetical protein
LGERKAKIPFQKQQAFFSIADSPLSRISEDDGPKSGRSIRIGFGMKATQRNPKTRRKGGFVQQLKAVLFK